MVAWSLEQPAANDRGLVGAIVVQHEVDVEIGWNRRIDPFEKIQELDGTMAPVALSQDVAGGDVERGEQAGDTMSCVVVGASFQLPDAHRQHGLGTAQGLDL